MRKIKKVEIGMLVSCPVGYDYSGKYMEYECAKVLEIRKSSKGEYLVARVKIWWHNTGVFTEKLMKLEYLKQISYYHMVNEKEMFNRALELEGIQVISGNLEFQRINDRCKDQGYINAVNWTYVSNLNKEC